MPDRADKSRVWRCRGAGEDEGDGGQGKLGKLGKLGKMRKRINNEPCMNKGQMTKDE